MHVDLAPDGRFLMVRAEEAGSTDPDGIVVVQNWVEELQAVFEDPQ